MTKKKKKMTKTQFPRGIEERIFLFAEKIKSFPVMTKNLKYLSWSE